MIYPMRTLVPVAFATLLSFGVMVAQDAPKGKGGPKAPPKNLKVLTPDNLIPTMQGFVAALGLADKGGCNFCHVQDRSSDEKMEKVMARMMITMVKDINARFPDGKDHVTCYTCHRGDTEPKMAP
jgi:Photosynthetic reaction centre cytochrome C subunit